MTLRLQQKHTALLIEFVDFHHIIAYIRGIQFNFITYSAISTGQDTGMPEEHKEKDINTKKSDSLDTKDIVLGVRELNIALKSVTIYPTEHDQVKASIERSFQALNNIFNYIPDITLAITGDSLMVGNEYLDPDNAICKEFALSLKLHDIAAVTFYRDIDRNELTRLLLLINKKSDDIIEKGGLAALFEKENLVNIKIKTVDYSKLSLTEEKEISRRKKGGEHKGGSDHHQETVWKNFVSHLVSETIADGKDGVSIDTLEDINPTELARFINENRIHTETALKTYNKVVTKHFTTPGTESQTTSAMNEPTYTKNGLTSKQNNLSYDLANWNKLLEELSPEVKQQFLSISFDHCESKNESAKTEEFLGSMSGGLIIDMLRSANQTGRGISPSLISLIRKLSAAQEGGLNVPDDLSAAFIRSGDSEEKNEEHLQTLFNREKHEDYVVEEYDDVLKKLTDSSPAESETKNDDFSIDDYLITLEDQHLNSRIVRILIGFMNGNIDREEYKAYADKLISLGKDCFDPPDFPLLLLILKTFSTHQKKKKDADIRWIAKESILIFREPAFTSNAVAAFFKDGGLSDQDGFHFLIELGPRIIPDVVKLYAEQDQPKMPGLLSGIITHFRKEALSEARKRLRDTRTLFVRNLIVMLRVLNATEVENSLKQLLEHSNIEIQMEALATLLQFKSELAVPALKKLVRSNQANISSKAIFLSGKYKVKDMVPMLTSMLKIFILFKADIKINEEIITALGQIADPGTIPVLEKLIHRTPLFHSKEIAKLKLLAYQSLSGYSYNDTKELLTKGSKGKNTEIKNICQQIINQKNHDKITEKESHE
jgi:hypothetical protein